MGARAVAAVGPWHGAPVPDRLLRENDIVTPHEMASICVWLESLDEVGFFPEEQEADDG